MADWRLRSLDVFDEPIKFHGDARDFYHYHADEIMRRAVALLDAVRRADANKAAELEQMIAGLSRVLRDAGTGHGNAVAHHESHRTFHLDAERVLTQGQPQPPTDGM